MGLNIKSRKFFSGWQDIFSRPRILPAGLEAPQSPRTDTEVIDYTGTLRLVRKPPAQRYFANLYEYLMVKEVKKTPGLVLVCSATKGEGATTVALGLANVAARNKQEKILLIDGNFHYPCLSQAWGLRQDIGFIDLLTGARDSAEVAQPTDLSNVWVIGAGGDKEERSRELEHDRLHTVFRKLATHYSFIVIDGPAINEYLESNLFAHYVHNVLLIIAAGISRAPVVSNAIAKFSPQVREKLELVLNRRKYPIPDLIYRKLWKY
ncbi:tyrosine-protein kinase family protein [Desulfobacca acetoxidans]